MERKRRAHNVCAIDLFCGIGGLTHGLSKAGIKVSAGIDNDTTCKYAYTANNLNSQFIEQDIQSIKYSDISKYYKKADTKVLVGCAPCQPFSAHRRKNGHTEDDTCDLVLEFLRIIKEGNPDIVSMENVPGLIKHSVFERFHQSLENLGYICTYNVVSCLDYNVPQNRKRLVFMASKLGKISLVAPQRKKKIKVSQYIMSLSPINHGETAVSDSAHTSLKLSPQNFKRITQSKPGGTWEDWEHELVSTCHRRAYYPAPYGRMSWDSPAPTITTQFCYYSTGRFGHPEQNRAISVREGALLQTFPKNYKFAKKKEKITVRQAAKHIGNAVPVNLAHAIGASIMEHVYGA